MTDAVITHTTSGSGEPLLLLNGGMMTMVAWEPIAAPLSASYRVIRCDLRGQLMSPAVPAPSIDAHVDDVVRLLDALEIERAHVLGTSFGGFVGMLLAARHPARVRSLVLATTSPYISDEDWAAGKVVGEACRAAAEGRGDGGRVMDLLIPVTFTERYRTENAAVLQARRNMSGMLPASYYAGAAGILAAMEGLDLRPTLAEIVCPTLVIAGAEDRMFPPDRARVMADGIRGASLVVLPGAAHGVVIEEPQRALDAVREFLDGLAAVPAGSGT